MTPYIFNKFLVTERHWHIFVTQRPLIFAFNSQTSDNFQQTKMDFSKISTNLAKCWELSKFPGFIFKSDKETMLKWQNLCDLKISL